MATVYAAEHLSTGARYAIKTLVATGDPEWVERFRREGMAQAKVDRHPNVVRVHSSGQAGGRLYLVMELVEGGDLASALESGPLPAWDAARLMRGLAAGVAHVHAHGILHRDLKPANVLLGADGTPKLIDFGLARQAEESSLTASGSVLGSPSYMAPEQAQGLRDEIDERTDVYGLGAILYECLTGQPPFKRQGVLATLQAVVHEPLPPPSSLAPVPEPLEAVCLRALAKAPRRRYDSATSFAAALDHALQETRGSSPTVGVRVRLAAGSLLVLGLIVLGAALAWVNRAQQASPSRSPLAESSPHIEAEDTTPAAQPEFDWEGSHALRMLALKASKLGSPEGDWPPPEDLGARATQLLEDGRDAEAIVWSYAAARSGSAAAMFDLGKRLRNPTPFAELDKKKLRFEPATGLAVLWEAGLQGSEQAATELADHCIRRCSRDPDSALEARIAAAWIAMAHDQHRRRRAHLKLVTRVPTSEPSLGEARALLVAHFPSCSRGFDWTSPALEEIAALGEAKAWREEFEAAEEEWIESEIEGLEDRLRAGEEAQRLAYARYFLARRDNGWAMHELGRALTVGKDGAGLDVEAGRVLMALAIERGSTRALLALGRSYDPNLLTSQPDGEFAAACYRAARPFGSHGDRAARLLSSLELDTDWLNTLLDRWPGPVTLEPERQQGE